MAPPKPKFAEGICVIIYVLVNYSFLKYDHSIFVFSGEKVLCFHGPLIYEAKCLKSSVTKDKHVRYFIHYAGWNKK